MAKYEFEENAIFHKRDEGDPQIIGDALERLSDENGGRLKPEHVVEAARSKRHPLHKHFEWSDKTAAAAYRLDQARSLIRSVRIVADEISNLSARAYHSISDDGRAYRSTNEIVTSTALQLALHQAALRDLMAWEKRYQSISGICPLVSVAREKLEAELQTMKAKQSAQQTKKAG